MAVIEGILYVGEAKSSRISKIRLSSGKKEVFVSSGVGSPLALGNDGENNLLVLDGAGHKLIKINPETLAISDVAVDLPVEYSTVGSYPSIEFPSPMFVSDNGDIYLTTTNRGILKLERGGEVIARPHSGSTGRRLPVHGGRCRFPILFL